MTLKKILFSILLNNTIILAFGQDTTYFDNDWNKVNLFINANYFRILERNENDTNIVIERDYFKSGQIQSEAHYSNYSKKTIKGKRKEWYENGQIKKDIDEDESLFQGQVFTYWENGQLQRQDKFEKGQFVEGKCWDINGNEIKHYDYLVLAKFQGGEEALFQYLKKETKYPNKASQKGIGGTVYVSFVVDTIGQITDAYILQSVHPLLDAEGLRVVKNMPLWIQGTENGKKVKILFTLPIRFRTVGNGCLW